MQIAELLLDHGALINIPGFDNETPLHDAVVNNKINVVKLLVSRGASVTDRYVVSISYFSLLSISIITYLYVYHACNL